jgi:hypothetical protein
VALELARGILNTQPGYLPAVDEAAVLQTVLTLSVSGALCGPTPPQTAIEQLHRAAELTLAHLPPGLRQALWQDATWLHCGAQGPQSTQARNRLALYSAISVRDSKAMLRQSRMLLESPSGGDNKWGRYLLTTAMLAARAMKDHEEVERLWKKYGNVLFAREMPLHISLLKAR